MKAVVVGIANLQTVVPVDGFPHRYTPARYLPGQINTTVGGVGFNVAKTIAALGDKVSLMCPLGSDAAAIAVVDEAISKQIDTTFATRSLDRTPRSVVLYDPDGRRQINTDIGSALKSQFTPADFTEAARGANVAVLGNLDFSRPLIQAAHDLAIPVAVDLQDVQGPDNAYDQDFLAGADILVMSHERLGGAHEEFLLKLRSKCRASLIVLTLGSGGSLALAPEMPQPLHTPAILTGSTANSIGAGDTFMGALLHYYLGAHEPMRDALAHASAAAAIMLTRPVQALTVEAVRELAGSRRVE